MLTVIFLPKWRRKSPKIERSYWLKYLANTSPRKFIYLQMESKKQETSEFLQAVVEIYDPDRSLGEGTIWCPLNNQLLWCDITRGKIFVYDYVTKTNIHLDMR